MGIAIEAWIEYDDNALFDPERAAEPPFSQNVDGSIPLDYFTEFCGTKNDRFLAAISGARRRESDTDPLFPMRGCLPPNVTLHTKRQVSEMTGEGDPLLSWLTYPEVERALSHIGVQREEMDISTNLVLDFMQCIERRLGTGHPRLIFYTQF